MKRMCRTCLSEVTNTKYLAMKNDAESLQVRSKLELCIPEMAVDLVMEPVVCLPCVSALHSAYDFKIRCLHTEKCLRNWIQDNKEQSSCIDLVEVFGLSQYTDDHLVLQDTACIVTNITKTLRDDTLDDNLEQGVKFENKFDHKEYKDDEEIKLEHDVRKLDAVHCIAHDVTDITKILPDNTLGGTHKQDVKVTNKFQYNKDDRIKSKYDEYVGDIRKLEDVKEELFIAPEYFDCVVDNGHGSSENSLGSQNNDSSLDDLQKSSERVKPFFVDVNRLPRGKQRLRQQQPYHMDNMKHTDEKRFECEVCEFKTAWKPCLEKHMRTHTGEKPFHCHVCKYKTADKGNLMRHLRIHTDEKPFQCKFCEYKTKYKQSLKAHIIKHTNEKRFECEVCEYRTIFKQNLKEHMKTHTGEKPFKCKICEFKTAWKRRLKTHAMVHAVEASFECQLCDYKTTLKQYLKEHTKIHIGECKVHVQPYGRKA